MKRFTMMAIGAILILASSCTSSKKLIYLQETKQELVVNQEIINSSELRIHNDDLLYHDKHITELWSKRQTATIKGFKLKDRKSFYAVLAFDDPFN